MKTISDKNRKNEGSESYRDFDLERIVGNMLISQYQAHILKSKLADRLAGCWILSQNREYDSSSFTFKVIVEFPQVTNGRAVNRYVM